VGDRCPPIDRAMLDGYHDWFVARGMLPQPGTGRGVPVVPVAEALDLRRLQQQVVQITGFADLGGDEWREPFTHLLEDMRQQRYRPGGLERATMRLVTALVRRAQLVDLHGRHPEIAAIDIPAPVIIAAPPRTGTTLLHNLLARDPRNRTFALWEMLSPVTPARATTAWTPHMIRVAEELVAETFERAPGLRAIHPLAALAPDECHWIMANSMTSQVFALMAHAPRYREWLRGADVRAAYRFYHATQQALLWREPGQRLVLKDPWHLWHLEELLEIYPAATIVLIHRDMTQVVPSRCSLARELIRIEAEPPDDRQLGQDSFGHLQDGLTRMQRVYAARPGSFVNLGYHELIRDPLAAVERIYGHRGWDIDDDARARMRAWLAANPKDRHGRHRYGLADFGLDEAAVRESLSAYEECFALWLDPEARGAQRVQ
ncbi:MAG: sulfotransferase, partial [Myxococcales bacterium]|nr:sulfotransferase [Myxococcales bacterium]